MTSVMRAAEYKDALSPPSSVCNAFNEHGVGSSLALHCRQQTVFERREKYIKTKPANYFVLFLLLQINFARAPIQLLNASLVFNQIKYEWQRKAHVRASCASSGL